MVFFEQNVTTPLGDRLFKANHRRAFGFSRAIAIVIAELLMLFIVGALLWLILPQIYLSINNIGLEQPELFRDDRGLGLAHI